MEQDQLFISCDWGTTAFRLRLVAIPGFAILAETRSRQGASTVFADWKSSGANEAARFSFYVSILKEQIKVLEQQAGRPLSGIPVIISGMASSTLGMLELPYKEAPFALDGSDLAARQFPAGEDFPFPLLLISGVKTSDDVMRGEETQVVGCRLPSTTAEQVILHPGTHCKHIFVKNGMVTSFKTYMTGELFSLLSTKSLLAASVEKEDDGAADENHAAFEAGVREGAAGNLLHVLFGVRTGQLFQKRSKPENLLFLSGLLIGSELNAIRQDYPGRIILTAEPLLVAQYSRALEILGIAQQPGQLIIKDADAITLAGQYAVYLNHRPA